MNESKLSSTSNKKKSALKNYVWNIQALELDAKLVVPN